MNLLFDQDFSALRRQCIQSQSLFEDPKFPATSESLSSSTGHVKWLRPKEISPGIAPEFFVDGFSRFDINQGGLGDCWFLAAAANLTQHPKLFYRVVPENNSFETNYAGIFHFW